ncbi:MAG: selenocysteine-specific translation elongation factor [Acidobacteriota bacterium]
MIHPIVIGTAGHIDHGKTSLVRALTGIDTDRLPVEKARGITTELGFARLDLGERRLAVVDVPGHERFVKSMVAGATGLDLVVLVIAADEGVMPQTREHLDICDLLGVRRGIVALTKKDLVDDEWLTMVTGDVRAALAGTFLDGAPIVPVSTRTGEGPDVERGGLRLPSGIDALRGELARAIDELPPRASTGVFRLPIDRVFTVKGFGTIVTGTVLGGEVALGDELTVIPSGLATRVRGIEVHGTAVERAHAGHRVALNVGGLAVSELARGDLLAHPGRVAGSHILDVELRLLRSAPPLHARSKVLVHHGTAQVLATVALVDRAELAPGATALAQLRLDRETPLGALPDDRFIVRGFVANAAGGSTIGGGRVLRVLAPRARKGAEHARAVTAIAAARLDQRVALDVQSAAAAGRGVDDLVRRLGVPAAALADPLATLVAGGELLATGDAEHPHYLHAATVAALEKQIVQLLADPEGQPREALRTQLPAALPPRGYDAILAGLERKGAIVAAADRVRRTSGQPQRSELSGVERDVLAKLEATGVEPPRPKELPAALGLAEPAVKTALDKLVAAKLAIKVKPDLIMHARTVQTIRDKLLAFLDEHGTIDAQQWKDLTGASRKFTIPLAEYFDQEKITLRVGDVRRRRK